MGLEISSEIAYFFFFKQSSWVTRRGPCIIKASLGVLWYLQLVWSHFLGRYLMYFGCILRNKWLLCLRSYRKPQQYNILGHSGPMVSRPYLSMTTGYIWWILPKVSESLGHSWGKNTHWRQAYNSPTFDINQILLLQVLLIQLYRFLCLSISTALCV